MNEWNMPTHLDPEKTYKETLDFGLVLTELAESLSIATILQTFRSNPKAISFNPFTIVLLLCAHALGLFVSALQLANKLANQNLSKLARVGYHFLSLAIITAALAIIPVLAATAAAALALTVTFSAAYLALGALFELSKAAINCALFLISPKGSFSRQHYGQKALGNLLTGLLYAGMAVMLVFPPTQPVAVALLTIGLVYSIGRMILHASPSLKKWAYKKVGLEIKEDAETSHTVKLNQQLGISNQTQAEIQRDSQFEDGYFKSLFKQAHYPQVIKRYLKEDKIATAKAYLLEQLTNKISALVGINKPKQQAKHQALTNAKALIENMESRAKAENPVTVQEIQAILDGEDDAEHGLIRQSFFVEVGDTEDLLNACKVFINSVKYEMEVTPAPQAPATVHWSLRAPSSTKQIEVNFLRYRGQAAVSPGVGRGTSKIINLYRR